MNNSFIKLMMSMGLSMMAEMEQAQEAHKERILAEWENSKKYPRKKKKEVRKHLSLEWSIANWSPFQDFSI